MQVRTSNSGRSAGVANRAPLVAMIGTRNASASRDERLVVGFLVAAVMPLHFDIRAIASEQADDPIEQAADAESMRVERGATDERDEPAGHAVECVDRQRTFAFG